MKTTDPPIEYTSEELERKDLSVACVDCQAEVGQPCSIAPLRHFCRRARWLVAERRPDLLPALN